MSPQLALIPVLLWLPFGHAQSDTASKTLTRTKLGRWTLTVQHDRFADETGCRLVNGRISYERGALVIHLPRKLDTADAVYRIDHGPPMFVQWDQSALATLGFALWQDDLDNPSVGIVRIPGTKLTTASSVQLEARPRTRIWNFKLDGLPAAVARAKQAGCD